MRERKATGEILISMERTNVKMVVGVFVLAMSLGAWSFRVENTLSAATVSMGQHEKEEEKVFENYDKALVQQAEQSDRIEESFIRLTTQVEKLNEKFDKIIEIVMSRTK